MSYGKNIVVIIASIMLFGCGGVAQHKTCMNAEEYRAMFEKKRSIDDFMKVYPRTVDEVKNLQKLCTNDAQQGLDLLLKIDAENRSFENTARALDVIQEHFSTMTSALHSLEMVSPEEAIRNACHEAVIELQKFAVDAFGSNVALYKAFKAYVDGNAKKEKLNNEETYFLEESMRDFKREGLHLPEDKLEEVKKVKKELAELTMAYETNIAQDQSFIAVPEHDLAGVDRDMVENLKRDDQGNCKVTCDYPTYNEVIENCTVEQTRKKLYFAFQNRAYPQNIEVLHNVIAKRDELAKKLGFESFAALDIDAAMAENPKTSEKFVDNLIGFAQKKSKKELLDFSHDLPTGVSLDKHGKFNPWDLSYIKNSYKKKHFSYDERMVAEHFEASKTIQGLFDIYQKFLGLKFNLVKPAWAWHEDVQVIQVFDSKTNDLRGYIVLDLYPRANKYSHACCYPIVHTVKQNNNGVITKTPSFSLVIANFPKATKNKPALLKHGDVTTFFHEFGHAMHGLLGSTEMNGFSGTSVKTDFVEMPSQMFEEWMYDKQMLKQVSAHYKTGKPLDDKTIDTLSELKKFDSGYFVLRQCWLSLLSLNYYKAGAHKDTNAITKALAEKLFLTVRFEPDTHYQAAFGHLMGYGAKYYSYMWAKVFALDIFEKINREGLLNPEAGRAFAQQVLGKGGSVAPDKILRDFLGREPNQQAFLRNLGMIE